VEWPDRAPGLTGQADLAITLSYDGVGRTIEVEGLSDRGKRLAASK